MTALRNTLSAAALSVAAMGANATDYTDGDTHKNDYKWMQANLMYALKELPRPDPHPRGDGHDYLEL